MAGLAVAPVVRVPLEHSEAFDAIQKMLLTASKQTTFVKLSSSFDKASAAISLLVNFHRIEVYLGGHSYGVWKMEASPDERFVILRDSPGRGVEMFIVVGPSFLEKLMEISEEYYTGYRTQVERRMKGAIR